MSSEYQLPVDISDANVRHIVTDPSRSFIVQAPAGSGKTELLMLRFLRVLAEAPLEEPESVLAITFTRKAASEMRNRILKALEEASRPLMPEEEQRYKAHDYERRRVAAEVLQRDAQHGWKLLENPSRLQVRTVDSFCDALARQMPVLASMARQLEVTDDPTPLYEEAAARTITLLGSDHKPIADAIARLLLDLDNRVTTARDLFTKMLGRRDQWMRILGRSDALEESELDELRLKLEEALADSVRHELRQVHRDVLALCGAEAVDKILQYASFAGDHVDAGDQLARLKGIVALPGTEVEDLAAWSALRNFVVIGDGKSIRKAFNVKFGFPKELASYRDECKAFFEVLGEAEGAARLCELLRRLDVLPPSRYTDQQWAFIRALLLALPVSVANLKIVCAEESKVDFIEVAQAAREALGPKDSPTDLGLALGAKIQHILVDEFQDTSISQIEFLQSLIGSWSSEGTSLFLVGDPMQSIYGFRAAEVTQFKRTWENRRFDVALDAMRLTSNFRSEAGLVEWFNATFPHILNGDNELTGAVKYAPCEAVKEAAECAAVAMHGFAPQDYESEAQRVTELIKGALQEDTEQRIAVLVRARSHLAHIVKALRESRVPFRAVKIDSLPERQVVRDLDALTRALVNLADRTSWLAVLRAPWCGLSLADLCHLCRDDEASTVWKLLSERIGSLSGEGQQRVQRVRAVLEGALQDRGRIPLRALVERTWVSLGGPAVLRDGESSANLRDAEAYLALIQQLEVGGLVADVDLLTRKMEELYAPPDTSPQLRVEIMTIHNAKGLEWDTVIVPGLGRSPQRDERQLLYWREQVLEGKDELLLAPMESVTARGEEKLGTIQKYLHQLADDRTYEESKRLLYVAATRAKKQLHLLATLPKTDRPGKGTLLDMLWNVAGIREQFAPQGEPESSENPQVNSARLLRSLPVEWTLPDAPTPLEWNAVAPVDMANTTPHTFEWVGQKLRRVGTVTHAFLERIAREGLEHWTRERIEDSAGAIRTALANTGLASQSLDEASAQVRKALLNTVTDVQGRWLLEQHAESDCELDLTVVLDGRVQRMKVDRTFVDGNGDRWVIDYKTSDPGSSRLEEFLKAQEDKYRQDLWRYARAMSLFDARPVRCGLYFPLLQAWREVPVE